MSSSNWPEPWHLMGPSRRSRSLLNNGAPPAVGGCGWNSVGVQGESDRQRDLLDVESVAGHLLEPGSVFAVLAGHRDRLFPTELFADLFPSGGGLCRHSAHHPHHPCHPDSALFSSLLG